MSDALFPLFLQLRGRKAVIVGAGPMALAKFVTLEKTGAAITVVAPAVREEFRGRSGITLLEREFAPSDLDGAWFTIAAAPAAVNQAVRNAADARRIFCNAVDDPKRASAFLPGVLERGGITIAIGSSGAAPALTGLLREGLEAVIPDEIETWVSAARAVRATWKAEGIPMPQRRPLLLQALNALYEEKL